MYHYPILSGPIFSKSFTMYMRKGREEDYTVFVDVDLCYISTVQTNGAQKGSSQNEHVPVVQPTGLDHGY